MNPSSVATGPIMNVLVLVNNMLFLLDVQPFRLPLPHAALLLVFRLPDQTAVTVQGTGSYPP